MNGKVHWPDGTKGNEPSDGFTYWVGNTLWMYDAAKQQWARINTVGANYSAKDGSDQIELQTFNPEEILDIPTIHEDKCECGSEAVGSNNHSHYCPKASRLYG